jgi:uncharacterized membrane protein
VGVVLLAVGVMFFFAANWSAFSGLARMGLVCVALAGTALLGLRLGLDSAAGRASLGLSALLIGPLLAVYGQTYQTGADSYELFLGWALLMTPYIFLVRWGGLVALQVVLLELCWGLFAFQVMGLRFFKDPAVHLSLVAMNLVGWGVAEAWVHRIVARTASGERPAIRVPRWLGRIFLLASMIFVVPLVAAELADDGVLRVIDRYPLEVISILVMLSVVWLRARSGQRDIFALTAVGMSLVLLSACEVGHVLEREMRDSFAIFWTGLYTMVSVGAVGSWARAHLKAAGGDPDDDERDIYDDAPAQGEVSHVG